MTYKEMGFSQEKKKSGITAALNFFFFNVILNLKT